MGRVALFFEPLTRREERAYPLRSMTDEQQSQRLKKGQPFGPGYFGPAGFVARSSRSFGYAPRSTPRRQDQIPPGAARVYLGYEF
jgi:hypothetical protein